MNPNKKVFTSRLLTRRVALLFLLCDINIFLIEASDGNPCNRHCHYVSWARNADCSRRRLMSVPQECSAAKVLNLNQNNITAVQPWTFSTFSHLKYLQILENHVTTISSNSFAGAYRLKCINFLWNELQVIPAHALNDTSSLKWVYLSHNRIRSIATGVFHESPTIEMLHLDFNKLHHLDQDVFKGLVNLRRLLLDNNLIEDLPEGIFKDLRKLDFVDLSYNRLQVLRRGVFTGLSSVRTIDLSGNRLTSVMPGTFSSINLVRLNISHNHLSTFSLSEVELEGVEEIGAVGNPWLCDCSLDPFRQALAEKLGEMASTVLCSEPPTMAQRPIVSVATLCTTPAPPTDPLRAESTNQIDAKPRSGNDEPDIKQARDVSITSPGFIALIVIMSITTVILFLFCAVYAPPVLRNYFGCKSSTGWKEKEIEAAEKKPPVQV
ncbi:uncharacterized protein [Diadema setosum]|uniref:uncharacterized protein n=1 Tax=Diadema setosum TaxID=31175 RepID=UPI003B3A66B0